MSLDIPHNAMIVIADGAHARFFRNVGREEKLHLTAAGELKPGHLMSEGPAGHRPKDSGHHGTDEATFAKQLAHDLYEKAHASEYAALVLIADPHTLGVIRPLLHKEVSSRIVREIHKTLTKASVADIERSLK